jgi:hypothetical protein
LSKPVKVTANNKDINLLCYRIYYGRKKIYTLGGNVT